jgi:hypothetical protein
MSVLSEMSLHHQNGSITEVNRLLEHLSHQCSDLRALTSGQGDVGKEWVALQRFNYSDYAIMSADSKVISLRYIMS